MVGQRHVIAPHIELPFTQAQYAAQHVPRMDADAHVHIKTGRLTNESALPRTNRLGHRDIEREWIERERERAQRKANYSRAKCNKGQTQAARLTKQTAFDLKSIHALQCIACMLPTTHAKSLSLSLSKAETTFMRAPHRCNLFQARS